MTPTRFSASGLAETAPAFAALGDPARLRIVTRLCSDGPQSIIQLTAGAEVSRQAVTKHLLVLERADLVSSGRAGRERIWRIQTRRLAEVSRYLDEISRQWDAALERLRAFVEE